MEPSHLGTSPCPHDAGPPQAGGLVGNVVPNAHPVSAPQSRHGQSGAPGVPVPAAAAAQGSASGAGAARQPRRCHAAAAPLRCRNVPPCPAQVPALRDTGTPSLVVPPNPCSPTTGHGHRAEHRATPQPALSTHCRAPSSLPLVWHCQMPASTWRAARQCCWPIAMPVGASPPQGCAKAPPPTSVPTGMASPRHWHPSSPMALAWR